MKKYTNIKNIFVFVIISVGCGFLVAFLYFLTSSRIIANQEHIFNLQMKAVINTISYDNNPLEHPIFIHAPQFLGTDKKMPMYVLKEKNKIVAFVFNAIAPDGYNGEITLLVALNTAGSVLGVRITKHQETPGLGDYFDKKNYQWLTQFIGKNNNLPNAAWEVRQEKGDFDAWSGATITPRAIIHAISRVVHYFEIHREVLLQNEK